jgi:BioD-like phosphotransacetylase family protein
MSKNIVISGETLTGKTMVAIAIAAKLREKGHKVSYFKPAGRKSFDYSSPSCDVDVDAVVMKEVLKLEHDVACICPIVRTLSSYDELLRTGTDTLWKKVDECYTKVSKDADFVLVEGTKAPWHLLHVGLSTPQVAQKLEASVICLVNFPDITAIDNVLLQKSFFAQYGVETISVVLSMVPPMFKNTITEKIEPYLKENGINLCGVIFQNRELFSPTIRDIQDVLAGEMLTGEDNLDVLIDQFMVGGMAPENALKWFRRAKDKAVITSGDRADMCLAALETDTNLLILVGGMGPDIRVVSRARELGVPIMMVAHDTYTTSKLVNGLVGTVTPENMTKVQVVERIVGEAIDLSCIGL